MRYFKLILFFCLSAQLSIGQESKDTVISKKLLDSLHRELEKSKEKINDLYWKSQINKKGVKIDTAFKQPNSYLLSYFSPEGKLILQEIAQLRHTRLVPSIQKYFDSQGRVIYIENWMVKNEDSMWDAEMESQERIEYDSLGRKVLHSIYFSTMKKRTEQTVFWYDLDGKQYQKINITKGYALWR